MVNPEEPSEPSDRADSEVVDLDEYREAQEMGRAGVEPATLGLKVPCSAS
jgi:hypothetical protein